MDIYMFNTGDKYRLYYNPLKTIEARVIEEPKKYADLGDRVEDALKKFGKQVKIASKKINLKISRGNSGILSEAAYAKNVTLNYADTLDEESARHRFGRIVKKETMKSYVILGLGIASLIATYIPPLLFVPMTSWIIGPIIGYQIAMRKKLKKGLKDISFAPNPEVSKLERIISGEKGLGLANSDLIEYRLAKDL
ncbi:MAG: hypothetical protein PHO02_03080 [Candidatus Nanoarchaeia archaeon]|nr:hypothetical protein [Candidatus Nanoarchaeia archaeon]